LNIWTKNLIFFEYFHKKNLVNLDKLKSFQPQINAANKLFRKTSHLSQKSKQTTKNNFTTLQEVLKASCNSRKSFKQQRKIFIRQQTIEFDIMKMILINFFSPSEQSRTEERENIFGSH
jgi:hypothetical protein